MTPYYQDSAVTIWHADCREVLPKITGVGVVIADPPFSVPVKYHDTDGDFPRSWGDLIVMEPFFADVFRAVRGTLMSDAQVYICCDDDSYPVFFKCALPLWSRSHLLVWYKPTGRRGGAWKHSFELVMYLSTAATTSTLAFRQDVFGIMPTRTLNREHPAEKPGDLATFLLEASTTNALVLDPFCGSGTTLRAAKDLGRKAIGIEIEERYCEIAAKRCSQEVFNFGARATA